MAHVPPTPRQLAWRSLWRILAIVVVAGLCMVGIGMAGVAVLMMAAIGSYGSNK